jgi:N6-L-threonylcarbamoyladenine synthase
VSVKLLAIETSCDETAAAVIADGREILSNIVATQTALHSPHGGVVPELAARHHLENLRPVICAAMAEAQLGFAALDAVAVTQGPGLVGALLVGIEAAKSIAFGAGKPLVPVHHIAGHVMAPFLGSAAIELPALALIVSGGHTSLFELPRLGTYVLLRKTRDDAAGEAFDKVAKLLGLGYPGGPIIDKLSREDGVNPRAVAFRRPKMSDGQPAFSFSGLKTAVLHHVRKAGIEPVTDPSHVSAEVKDLVASFQHAAVDALVAALTQTAQERRPRSLILSGGVAANSLLRKEAAAAAHALGLPLHVPPIALSTDNAAMIGAAGYINFVNGLRADWNLDADPQLAMF